MALTGNGQADARGQSLTEGESREDSKKCREAHLRNSVRSTWDRVSSFRRRETYYMILCGDRATSVPGDRGVFALAVKSRRRSRP